MSFISLESPISHLLNKVQLVRIVHSWYEQNELNLWVMLKNNMKIPCNILLLVFTLFWSFNGLQGLPGGCQSQVENWYLIGT